MLDLCLLGSGGMMPLPRRWLTALMTRYNGSSLLIDCGEGTQIAIKEKGWSYQGCMQIVMPENYIALYDAPKKQEALTIIHNAEKQIAEAAEYIRTNRRIPKPEISVRDFVNSAWINPLFYPLIVHADKFYATDACISCGKCEQVCPLGNIQLKQGVPDWGKSCTHCMACICNCPKEAIEYGNSSKGKVRYLCSHVVSKEE